MDYGLTLEQADQLEHYLADELQLPAELRIEVAGLAVARAALDVMAGSLIRSDSPEAILPVEDDRQKPANPPVVLAGPGWIGATALVAARWLLTWGTEPIVLLGTPRERLTTVAMAEADRFELLDGRIFEPGAPLPIAGLWIDGLFGSHFREPLSDELRDLIDAVNHDHQPTLAIDLPSGLDATTGKASLPAIRADLTLALGYPTLGVLKPFTAPLVGQLLVADVGIPPHIWRRVGITDAPIFDSKPYRPWDTDGARRVVH